MQRIIGVVNEKGGSGKTTVATNLAAGLQRAGRRVVLVDADEQHSAKDWREATPADVNMPPVIVIARHADLSRGLQSINAEVIVIDGPAKASAMTAHIISLAHIVLVPMQPTGTDLRATAATLKLLLPRLRKGGDFSAAFVATRTSDKRRLTREFRDGAWNTYGVDMLRTGISDMPVYAEAATDGKSVYEFRNGQARGEIDNILMEMEEAKWL
jgi:chromosome partitioning protein